MGMSMKVKKFFDKLDDKNSLLFKKLYYKPESVLGNEQDMDKAEEEYYNLFYYYDLMMNNNLLDFIITTYYDNDFRDRTKDNIQIWRKLNFFVYDSLEFKKYHFIKDDQELIDVLESRIPIKEYLNKHKPKYALMTLYEYYTNNKRLFEHNYDSSYIEQYDEKKAKEARSNLYSVLTVMREKLYKKDHKEVVLRWIQEDNYETESDSENAYLYTHFINNPALDSSVLDNLVCENRFLDIIEEQLENKKLKDIALDNAISIIRMGIDVKSYQAVEWDLYQNRIGLEVVKSFDINHANQLLYKLVKYKSKLDNSKVKKNRYRNYLF